MNYIPTNMKSRVKDIWTAFILALPVAVMISWCSPPAHCKGNDPKKSVESQEISGWSVDQSSKFFGDTRIFVSKQGFKLTRLRDDLVMVAKPPDWTVTSYKPQSRKFCRHELKDFGNLTKLYLKPIKMPRLRVVPGSEQTLWNVRTVTFTSGLISFDTDSEQRTVSSGKIVFTANLVSASNLGLPAEISTLVSKYYGVPEVPGLPLQFRYSRPVQGDQLNLETKTLKPAKLHIDCLEMPKGYQLVTDIRAVNIDAESSKFIDEFVNTLGPKN